jgi:hypothetical protein
VKKGKAQQRIVHAMQINEEIWINEWQLLIGWMDGWMDGWVDGWMDEYKWMEIFIKKFVNIVIVKS